MKSILAALCLISCACCTLKAQADFAGAMEAGELKMGGRKVKWGATYFVSPENIEAARKDFAKALEMARDDREKASAMEGLADTFYLGMEYEKARSEDSKILLLKGSTPGQRIDAQFRIAESFMGYRFKEMPDFPRARAGYSKVLNMDGVSPENKAMAIFGAGRSFSAERKYAEARAEYAKIFEVEGVRPGLKVEAQYNIGANYRAEGKFDMAREAYAKILEMKEAGPSYREIARLMIENIYW